MQMLKNVITKQAEKGNYFILCANDRTKAKGWNEIPFRYVDEEKLDFQLQNFMKEYPENVYDLYFCPIIYKDKRRRKAEAQEIKFLWSDVDENTSPESLDPAPTYIWESSEGKYQALWELDRYIDWEEAEVINKALNRSIGADRCYDVGHVLRIPGTTNHKYKNNQKVGEAKHVEGRLYRPAKLKKQLGIGKSSKTNKKANIGEIKASRMDIIDIIDKYKLDEDKYLFNLLTTPKNKITKDDDTSETLWQITALLFEAGLTKEENKKLLGICEWNKFHKRKDEDIRLDDMINKVYSPDRYKDISSLSFLRYRKKKEKTFKLTTSSELLGKEFVDPGWLVEDWWGYNSYGIVAGQPKVYKSTYVQDLAISVASGKPFLGKFKVHNPGPVIYINQENKEEYMADREIKIGTAKNLYDGKAEFVDNNNRKINIKWNKDISLAYINQQNFNFTLEEHRRALEDMIEEIKPVLVVFDPLYLMVGGVNINNADEVQPILQWLTKLNGEYKTSIIVVHHYNKGNTERGGQNMMGSGTLHGWVDSAWYMRRLPPDECPIPEADVNAIRGEGLSNPVYTVVEREFRSSSSGKPMKLGVQMASKGELGYHVSVEEYEGVQASVANANNKEKVATALLAIKDWLRDKNKPQSKKNIMEGVWECNKDLKISKSIMNEAIDELSKDPDVIFKRINNDRGWMTRDKYTELDGNKLLGFFNKNFGTNLKNISYEKLVEYARDIDRGDLTPEDVVELENKGEIN